MSGGESVCVCVGKDVLVNHGNPGACDLRLALIEQLDGAIVAASRDPFRISQVLSRLCHLPPLLKHIPSTIQLSRMFPHNHPIKPVQMTVAREVFPTAWAVRR